MNENQKEKLVISLKDDIFAGNDSNTGAFAVKAFILNVHSITEMQVPKNAKLLGPGIHINQPCVNFVVNANQKEIETRVFRITNPSQEIAVRDSEEYELVAAMGGPQGTLFIWEIKNYVKPQVHILK